MKTPEINNHAAWVSATFLLSTPLAAIVLTTWYVMTTPFQPAIWILGILMYTFSILSITGGYHRMYSHRAYKASKPLKWFFALFGAAAFEHSILKWSLDHRLHHRYVDTDKDPYSIKKGFWYAHLGWMLQEQTYQPNAEAYVRDLERDPIVVLQHNYYIPIAIFMCFLLPMGIGWMLGSALGGLAVGGFLRLVLGHHATFFINSLCHTWGQRNFTHEHTAKDSPITALFTMGEGYHNFHHTFANDYRNGIRWYHWDPTKWMIRSLAALDLAHDLNVVSDAEILAARLTTDETKLREKWSHRWEVAFEDRLTHMKERVANAQKKWMELKAEYKAMKKSYRDSSQAHLDRIRAEMKMARLEFKMTFKQWRAYQAFLLGAAPARVRI